MESIFYPIISGISFNAIGITLFYFGFKEETKKIKEGKIESGNVVETKDEIKNEEVGEYEDLDEEVSEHEDFDEYEDKVNQNNHLKNEVIIKKSKNQSSNNDKEKGVKVFIEEDDFEDKFERFENHEEQGEIIKNYEVSYQDDEYYEEKETQEMENMKETEAVETNQVKSDFNVSENEIALKLAALQKEFGNSVEKEQNLEGEEYKKEFDPTLLLNIKPEETTEKMTETVEENNDGEDEISRRLKEYQKSFDK